MLFEDHRILLCAPIPEEFLVDLRDGILLYLRRDDNLNVEQDYLLEVLDCQLLDQLLMHAFHIVQCLLSIPVGFVLQQPLA